MSAESLFWAAPTSAHRLTCPLQYGAGLVESSVKAVSKPVINRLPVDQLDEFACRQLDRVRAPSRVWFWLESMGG